MVKFFKHFGYPYIAFFLVIGLLISYKELVLIPHVEKNGTVLSATVSVFGGDEVSPEELVINYQSNIKEILLKLEVLVDSQKAYSGNANPVSAIDEIEQELLNTKVPEIYRELHLELFRIVQSVKQVNLEEQGLEFLLDTQSSIEKIKDQYAWF